MSLRTVSGLLLTLEGKPVANDEVKIRLVGGTYTPEASYISSLKVARTTAEGVLEAELLANEEGDQASHYEVTLPDGETFGFVLPPGTTPLTWSQVRAAGVTQSDPQYSTLASFVSEEINDRLAQGGVLPVDENGTIIIDAGLL